MFREDDRIGVAISGGKDSAVLLHVLWQIEKKYPQAELVPFTIDEGIKGYRDEALLAARRLVRRLNLDLHVASFKKLFGLTLDMIIRTRRQNGLGACSYCGVLRRKALNDVASDLGLDVIATGHNLNDEAQTIIMNVVRGDARRIARTHRLRSHSVAGFVPRVKPLTEVTERDIVAYAYFAQLPYHDIPCPYAGEALRNDIRSFLNRMEYRRPGTLLAVLRSGEIISEALEHTLPRSRISICEQCGFPTTGRVCKTCEIIGRLQAGEQS